MRIFVSARLQATAPPEAPEPMMRTSTLSSMAPRSLGRRAPERGAGLDRVEKGPVALVADMALGEGRAGFEPEIAAARNSVTCQKLVGPS